MAQIERWRQARSPGDQKPADIQAHGEHVAHDFAPQKVYQIWLALKPAGLTEIDSTTYIPWPIMTTA
ncbi:hypothetical protein AB0R99_00380, partial [Erwinia amylovora]|uniref:hypothetical protein n=1 Tax=Erwinia amylovora TaxID=552 RepID=UPI0037DD7F0C